jgi:hypothetical protein
MTGLFFVQTCVAPGAGIVQIPPLTHRPAFPLQAHFTHTS